MRSPRPAVLAAVVLSLLASACKGGDPAPAGPRLVIQPDDGRAFILDAIPPPSASDTPSLAQACTSGSQCATIGCPP